MHALSHFQADGLKGIPNEEPWRRPLAHDASVPFADGFDCLLCVCGIDLRDPQADGRSKVRIAPRHHGQMALSRSTASPRIGYAEEVLGVVDLHGVAFRYAPDGMPEGVVRMGHNGDSSLLMSHLRRLLRASSPGQKLTDSQDQQMAFGGGDFSSWNQNQIQLLLFDDRGCDL